MKEEQENVTARETSPTGDDPAFALMVDTQIMRLLGLRFEIQDGFIKVWPNDVVPDDTNWLVGERFTLNIDESMNVLAGLKVEVEFFEEEGMHWATVTFPDEGELQTQEVHSKEMAAACATFCALYGRSGGQSPVT